MEKYMKKFVMTALVAGSAFVPVAEAAQVRFTSPDWRDTTYGGGEFAADILGTGGNVDFYTFCLERNEGLGFNTTYNFTTSGAAEAGGLGGGNPDPISEGTAFLYELFTKGTLPNYNFATGNPVDNAARAASGRTLQNAIWSLENEQAVNFSNIFIQAVINEFGSIGAAMADSTRAGIGVMNPTRTTGSPNDPFYRRQSVLISLPDNGMAAAMLGGGLMLIGAARRRFA
jgi:hypothetical protein